MSDNSTCTPYIHGTLERRVRAFWLVAGLGLFAFAWYGSLVPFDFSSRSLSEAWARFTNLPVDWQDGSKVDWGVNALLLVPAGFCLLGAATRFDLSLWQRLIRTAAVAASCLMMSLLIEFSQNWFPPRVPSPADVLAQFSGAAAGMAGWWLFGTRFDRALVEFLSQRRTSSQLELILLVYAAGLAVYSLAPLDLTLHPLELLHKYRDGRILLVPFARHVGSIETLLYDVISEILLFIPIGMFSATFQSSQRGAIRSRTSSLLVGGMFVAGIELLQVFVMSRYADATDLVTGFVGVAAGVFGFHHFSGRTVMTNTSATRKQIRLLICAALYVLLLLAIFWAPYNFTISGNSWHRSSLFFGVPLSRALAGDYFSALTGFIQKFLLFAPLGAWIVLFASTLKPAMRFVTTLGLLFLTVILALAIELVQITLPSRFGSFDDVMICVAGSLVGLWAMSRAKTSHRSGNYSPALSAPIKPSTGGSKVRSDMFPMDRRANEALRRDASN
ncbi:MAG: VanZ family protein [Pirellulales bacterium]